MLKRYLARRLLVAVPSLLIASAIVFMLPRLIPGDAVQLMLAETSYAKDIDELRAKLGLDRPFHVQYVEWLGRAARGDLGESLWTRRPVLSELAQRLPVTGELALYATVSALLIALPIGVVAAARQDSHSDYVLRSLLHRRLVAEVGRRDTPGRPILYGTTFTFLERFGLTSLEELPALPAEAALPEPAEAALPEPADAG